MRTIAIVASLVFSAGIAFADGGGSVKPPVVGTVNPSLSGAEPGVPNGTKSALGTGEAPSVASAPVGTDTSTAAPGGAAESSKNGALSAPNTDRDAANDGHPKPLKPSDAKSDTPN